MISHELGLRSARGVLDLPRLDFWIPSTVVLASIEVDIGGYLLSYSQGELLDSLTKELDWHFAGEASACIKDEHLRLP